MLKRNWWLENFVFMRARVLEGLFEDALVQGGSIIASQHHGIDAPRHRGIEDWNRRGIDEIEASMVSTLNFEEQGNPSKVSPPQRGGF